MQGWDKGSRDEEVRGGIGSVADGGGGGRYLLAGRWAKTGES